jgi:hypothetical protein
MSPIIIQQRNGLSQTAVDHGFGVKPASKPPGSSFIQSVATVNVPPVTGVLAAIVAVVVAEVVVLLLQEVSTDAEIKDATIKKLNPKNRIFFFTSFSP